MTETSSAPHPLGVGRALRLLLPLAILVTGADQLTKQWALNELSLGHAATPLIGDWIGLRLVFNPGAAFSFGSGSTWILTIVSCAVVVYIVVVARKLTSRVWLVTLALLLGGALGNLLDRLFRDPGFPTGHVVDFIDYGPFVGNVADIFIVGAAGALAALSLFGVPAFATSQGPQPAAESLEDGREGPLENDEVGRS